MTFGGRYQLGNRIAIGGMGEVWQATDLIIERTVAIKILKDEYLGDPGFLERFRAEARHAALVNHEGIANVYDYGEEDGSAFLVMELVPGEALSALIERDRSLPVDRVLDIVAQTAAALHAAHTAGLVHRDIKPGNLLITPDGRVKITDFGIARIADQVPLTATGQVMGTVQYLSPEQASGKPASPATDIYSLGIVAYEALAGKRPFTGESQVAIAMAQINEAPPELPPSIPEPVRNLVMSAIAKNPKDRPASAQHLARAAQLLRRGDIAGAAAAVPGILSPTVMAQVGAVDRVGSATIPLVGPDGSPRTRPTQIQQAKRSSPWLWPLIAIIAILVLALAAVITAILVNQGGSAPEPTDTPTQSSEPPPTPTPTQTTPPAPDTVPLPEDEVLGKNQEEVAALLEGLGLGFDPRTGSPAPTADEVGRAYMVAPYGPAIEKGKVVTVTFYGEYVPPTPDLTQPAPLSVSPKGPYLPGEDVTVSWPAYTACNADYPLTGYTLTVTPDGGDPWVQELPGSDTSLRFPLTEEPGGKTTVSYVAVCDTLSSPESEILELSVKGN